MRTAHYTAQPVEAGAGGTRCRAAETSISYLLCPPAPCVSCGLSGPFPSRDDGQCAEAGHRLSPGHPATHISTSGCSKNAEGDISCSSRCVAALLKAAGIVREEKALPEIKKKKSPAHGPRGRVGTDIVFIFTILSFPTSPSEASWNPRLTPARM